MGKVASVLRRPRNGQLGQLLLLASEGKLPRGHCFAWGYLCTFLLTRFCAEEGEPAARATEGLDFSEGLLFQESKASL